MSTSLKRQLGLWQGVSLGIGSIMGSGILFLPSLTVEEAGLGSILSWVLCVALCLPLLVVFRELISDVPNEAGVSGFLELGLGKHVANSLPILMLGTVLIGMPSAMLIAGEYLESMLQVGGAKEFLAISIVLVSVGVNLKGISFSSGYQMLVAAALFVFAVALMTLSAPKALPHPAIVAQGFEWKGIVSGAVLAFWAFAGFENMSFLAGEFKNPKRDLNRAILISLLICAVPYIGLTLNYAVLAESGQTTSSSTTTGLMALASHSAFPNLLSALVVLLAIGAVLLNSNSWTWGISRMIFSSAEKGFLPSHLGKLNSRSLPRNALVFLAIAFCSNIALATLFPEFFRVGLEAVSTNFVFVYILIVLSFLVRTQSRLLRVGAGVVLSGLVFAFLQMGLLAVYSIGLVGTGVLISFLKNREVVVESAS